MHPAGLAGAASPADGDPLTSASTVSTGADGATYLGGTPCSSYYGQKTDTTDPEFSGAPQPYAVCGYVPSQMRSAYGVAGGGDGQVVTVGIVDAYTGRRLCSVAQLFCA